jgi:hypothetical protein
MTAAHLFSGCTANPHLHFVPLLSLCFLPLSFISAKDKDPCRHSFILFLKKKKLQTETKRADYRIRNEEIYNSVFCRMILNNIVSK